MREVAASFSLGEFMVETDCPYLAPSPFRGKRCEPAHTRLVAESIAAARGVSLEEMAGATTERPRNSSGFTAHELTRFAAALSSALRANLVRRFLHQRRSRAIR